MKKRVNRKKQSNEKQKLIYIIIGAVVGMFLIYNLFLSPYSQCVSGYIKLYDDQYSNKYKSELRATAKLHCKAIGR